MTIISDHSAADCRRFRQAAHCRNRQARHEPNPAIRTLRRTQALHNYQLATIPLYLHLFNAWNTPGIAQQSNSNEIA